MKIGIFGMSRGWWYAIMMQKAQTELVAICDCDTQRLDKAMELLAPGGKAYTDFDEFINHEMDAVIVCNYFNLHVDYVVRLFERGIHVLCETMSNSTMAEGVYLVRQWEKYNKINGVKYMLAENYPFMKGVLELKHLRESGKLGRVLYSEGEYNHPSPPGFFEQITPSEYHWRAWLPPTYYNTHAFGPVMYATGARPTSVTAKTVYVPSKDNGGRKNPEIAVMLVSMSDGSVSRVQGCTSWGGEGNHYLIGGERATAETVRGNEESINIRYNYWEKAEDETDGVYKPEWHICDESDLSLCEGFGHGGSDFWMLREFVSCVFKDKQPFFDVYRSTEMASVAILGWYSVLEGRSYDIPDFRNEEDRLLWQDDTRNPFPDESGEGVTLPCCSVKR